MLPGGSSSIRNQKSEIKNQQFLEPPPQRKLDQPRISRALQNFSKRAVRRTRQVRLDIGQRRISKICVVPQIEEVRRKPHLLPLPLFARG
jgi:hypothetical protein